MSEVKFKNTNGEWITGFKDVEVVNDLTTSNSSKGVAALQGKELNDKIDTRKMNNIMSSYTVSLETNKTYSWNGSIAEKLTLTMPTQLDEGLNEITLTFETWQGFEIEVIGDHFIKELLPNYVYELKARYIKNQWVFKIEKALKLMTARLIGTLTDGSEFDESYRSEDEAKAFITSHQGDLETIKIIEEDGMFTSCSDLFNGCSVVKEIDLSEFNTENATSFYRAIANCTNLIKVNLDNLNTANATNMLGMFRYCPSLISLDLSNFDTSKVTTMRSMFYECKNLETVDVSSWDISNVTSLFAIFYGCAALKAIDVSKWDTSKVEFMSHVFHGCRQLTEIDTSRMGFR